MPTKRPQQKPDAYLPYIEFSAHSPRQPMYGRGHLVDAEFYAQRINRLRATSRWVARQLSPAEVRRLKLAERDDVFIVTAELAKLEQRQP